MPIVPAVIIEHIAIPCKLPDVVALIRDKGYAVTQDVDPISHQLMWKLSSLEGKQGEFLPEEDEALQNALDRMKKGRMVIMPFSLADTVRSVLPIRPTRCREWLEAHDWVEQTGQGWVEVGR